MKDVAESFSKAETFYTALIENSYDAIALTDENFKVLYRSPSAERISGWTIEERQKIGTIELTHPDDLETLKEALKEVLANPGKPINVLFRSRHKDGHYVWFEGVITNGLHDENVNGIIFNLRDITERKKSEENLEKIIREISDYKYALDESSIVAITDQKGIIKHANDNFCKISKYNREELIGQDHRIINSAYHPKEFIRNLWVTIANGKIWRGELKNKAKDGTIYWVDTTIVPFLNEQGKPYQYVAIRADITERKNIEENLERSLKETSDYKYALDESSIVAITDQKGIIKYANDNFCKISKYRRDELIGQDHRIINSTYHPKEFIRNLWVTIANGKIWKGELKNKAKDGTIYWVDTTIVPFLNEHGKPYQYVAIRADITERKNVEENLKKSLKEISDYKYALEESSIVAITDQKGIIKYANGNFCNISKYSRKELIGQDHRIINSGYHTKEFIKELWRTIANGKIWRGELKNKAKDGTIYWVDTTIVPFLNEHGKPYQYVAIRADITERKRIEENLEKSLKETSDYKYALEESSIVAITDQKGIILHANDNFCKISKYSREELIGQDHRIINSGYHAKEFIKELWRTIAHGKIWRGELKNKAKDGTIYWVDTTIVPFLNEQGKPYQYIAIRADITERKRVEELLIANKDLVFQSEEKAKRAAKLILANKELVFQNEEKEKRAAELIVANKELAFQSEEKEKRAAELIVANEELIFQNDEKEKRAAELKIANKELAFQSAEKEKRAAELLIANKELLFQNDEKGKRAAELSETLERVSFLATIADNIQDPVISTTNSAENNFIITRWNKSAEKLFEWKSEEVIGKNAIEIFNTSYPYETREQIFESWKANGFWQGELIYHTKSGKPVPVLSTLSYLKDYKGNITGNLVLVRDITVRKKTEEALSKLNEELEHRVSERTEAVEKTLQEKNIILESIGDAFFAVDKDWKVTYWNRVAEIALGVPKAKIVDKNLWEIFSDSIDSLSYIKYHEALATNQVVHFEDYYAALHKWYEISAYPSENGLSVYFKDVTERKKAAEEIAKNLVELERSNKELEQFAYIASHDLQEPLRMVGSYMQLIERRYKGKLDADADEFIHFAVDGANRMKQLIGDLLNYSRMNKEGNIAPVDMNEVMKDVMQNLSSAVKDSKANVSYTEMPVIEADRTQMMQLFQNLIGNAIKFSKEGVTPVITINAVRQESRWLFSIADNGIGIERQYSEKIFIVFKQLHTKAKYGGTGIGLAIAKKIVERHGGKIWFESETGKGTTFYFTLNTKI